IYTRHFNNGSKKKILYSLGIDTMKFIKYYKNGQVRDSSFFYYAGDEEIPFKTSKSYYENGTPENITHYGINRYEFTSVSYWPDGSISEQQISPGVKKRYNKKGELIHQMNLNHGEHIYVPREYRQEKHLLKGSYTSRINFKNAELISQKKQVNLKHGGLISIALTTDTNILHLCKIEGFSSDSIYLSKFTYNHLYDGTEKHLILNYDSTFALNNKQLKTIYYSKYGTGKRNIVATTTYIFGVEFIIISFITTAVAVREPSLGLPILAGTLASGIALIKYAKHQYKTMIPKKYDLLEWKIQVKN
ncbi:MAG: hypothetical protein H0W73_17875, partial [Bacteroidetes bacterium]|nr:hypothetical protein [Bacteroidota bacterium]